ncbi:MAG: hypothetical protein PUF50_05895 [Erysipelotrichaceae bacterium]|nr:hypothetical protein [Erysipelotrichaceae bacterium]
MKPIRQSFYLEDLLVESLHVYEGLCRDLLIQYKELCDEALYPVFLFSHISYLRKKYDGYVLVGMPSSEKASRKRGFSHVEQMFQVLGMPMITLFEKEEMEEQKHATKEQRYQVRSHIHLQKQVKLPDAPILLVDDVCTTGNTLLAAAYLIQNHAYPVRALVYSCHASYVEKRRCKLIEFIDRQRYTQHK